MRRTLTNWADILLILKHGKNNSGETAKTTVELDHFPVQPPFP